MAPGLGGSEVQRTGRQGRSTGAPDRLPDRLLRHGAATATRGPSWWPPVIARNKVAGPSLEHVRRQVIESRGEGISGLRADAFGLAWFLPIHGLSEGARS